VTGQDKDLPAIIPATMIELVSDVSETVCLHHMMIIAPELCEREEERRSAGIVRETMYFLKGGGGAEK
jgi:hypothetical protein